MIGGRQIRWFGLAVLMTAVAPSFAHAAWLGYKNNTTAVVVIQASDVVIVNGQVKQVRPGKAHALYPGEVAWDPITAPGPRLVAVYDPKQKNRLLYQDRVDCNKNDIFLSLQLVQPPQVPGRPAQPAKLVLLPLVIPAERRNSAARIDAAEPDAAGRQAAAGQSYGSWHWPADETKYASGYTSGQAEGTGSVVAQRRDPAAVLIQILLTVGASYICIQIGWFIAASYVVSEGKALYDDPHIHLYGSTRRGARAFTLGWLPSAGAWVGGCLPWLWLVISDWRHKRKAALSPN